MLCLITIIIILVKPVVTAVGNSSVSIYEGNTTTFVCRAIAVPRPTIIWTNEDNIHIGGRIQKNEGSSQL